MHIEQCLTLILLKSARLQRKILSNYLLISTEQNKIV